MSSLGENTGQYIRRGKISEDDGTERESRGVQIIAAGGKICMSRGFRQSLEHRTPISKYLQEIIKIPEIPGHPLHPIKEIQVPDDLQSRSLTRIERDEIPYRAAESNARISLVLHGRDTLLDTADFLHHRCESFRGKIVLLLSSRETFYGDNTDARFNLGFALGAGQLIPSDESAGRVAMVDAGKIFHPDDTDFREEDGQFIDLRRKSESSILWKLENLSEVGVILTGGTIDGWPNYTRDGVIEARDISTIPEFLEKLRLHFRTAIYDVVMIDSRKMTPKIRKAIVKNIHNTREEVYIVTHGTYTMIDSAKFLKDKADKGRGKLGREIADKRTLFVGSKIPLKGSTETDADFNLGYALGSASQMTEGGVYVAMNAQILDPNHAQKDIKTGIFKPV